MPLFSSRLFGSSPFAGTSGVAPAPAPPGTADDLDAAIVARFEADATLPTLAAGGVHAERAPQQAPAAPYVVFRVGGGSEAFASGSSTWLNQRVRFECFAATTAAAGEVARAVLACYGDGASRPVALSHAGGVTAPLVPAGNYEVAERPRGPNNARVCRAVVEYSARCRLGRPS